jgi:hypothetical protein
MVFSILGLLGLSEPAAAMPGDPMEYLACTKLADSVGGTDGGTGTPDDPVRTFEQLEQRLVPGDVGCVRGGAGQKYDWVKANYTDPDRTVSIEVSGTSAAAPVVIQSEPGRERAVLRGAIQIKSPFVTLRYLNLDGFNLNGNNTSGSEGKTLPSPLILADDVSILGNDITNAGTADLETGGICVHPDGDIANTVDRVKVQDNRIHDCGRNSQEGRDHDHAIYASWTRNLYVEGNFIYDNEGRGVQLRMDADDSLVEHNVIDNNNVGVIFSGDVEGNVYPADRYVSDNNEVRNNAITYSYPRYNVDSWYPADGTPAGVGNTVHDNCVLNGNYGNFSISDKGGYTQSSNTAYGGGSDPDVDPGYVDRAAKDFRLKPGSLCAQYLPELVDDAAPDTKITSGPAGGATTYELNISFGFSATDDPQDPADGPSSTFQCSLDGGAWTSCASPKTYSSLAAGQHTFRVRALDGAGNIDGTPASRTFTKATYRLLYEAESFATRSASTPNVSDTTASGDLHVALLDSGDFISRTFNTAYGTTGGTARVRAFNCSGSPTLRVRVDGTLRYTGTLSSTSWVLVPFDTGYLAPGPHEVRVEMGGDYATASCNRSIRVDWVRLER